MIFEFAVATDVTKLAHKLNPDYENSSITKVFLTQDVWDTHLHRVVKDYNKDYEHEEGVYMLEWEKIPHDYKGQKLDLKRAKKILEEDDFSSWDVMECYSEEEAVEEVDGGFGIN